MNELAAQVREFVSRDTTNNYQFMLETLDSYSESSDEVNNMVIDFHQTAEKLEESIHWPNVVGGLFLLGFAIDNM